MENQSFISLGISVRMKLCQLIVAPFKHLMVHPALCEYALLLGIYAYRHWKQLNSCLYFKMSVCVCKKPFKVFVQVRLFSHRTLFEPEINVYDTFIILFIGLFGSLFFSCTFPFLLLSFFFILLQLSLSSTATVELAGHCGEVPLLKQISQMGRKYVAAVET